ncbi:flippase-like domain-containing protein [Candidatus Desantisbacteria bacterium]|nr:flippase-like domain-containing protein [Candidatus Desantisbacteria bacterium]
MNGIKARDICKMKNKMVVKIIISVLIGFLLIGGWLRFINIDRMMVYLRDVDFRWVLGANVLFFGAYIIRALRWRAIIEPIERLTIGETCKLYMAGLAINFLLPFHIGQMAQPILLKQMKGVPISKSLPTLFIDRVMNLFSIIILCLLIPCLPGMIGSAILAGIGFIFICLIMLCGIIWFMSEKKDVSVELTRRVVSLFPCVIQKKIGNFSTNFVKGFSDIKQGHHRFGWFIGLTFLAMGMECMYLWGIFYSLGVNVPLIVVCFGYIFIYLASIIPPPPARVGTTQAFWMLVFTLTFGLDKNLVSAAVTISYLFTAVLICVIGMISLGLIGVGFVRAIKLSTNGRIDEK